MRTFLTSKRFGTSLDASTFGFISTSRGGGQRRAGARVSRGVGAGGKSGRTSHGCSVSRGMRGSKVELVKSRRRERGRGWSESTHST